MLYVIENQNLIVCILLFDFFLNKMFMGNNIYLFICCWQYFSKFKLSNNNSRLWFF